MTSGPWLPLALLVVPTLAALMVVAVGLLQLVFGSREVVQLPRAVAVTAPAAARVARGTAPPPHRPQPVVVPQFMQPAPVSRATIERAPTVRAQPVRPSRPQFEDDEPTAFYVRQFAAR